MSEERQGKRPSVYVGTAGWAIPKTVAGDFGGEGSALARYSERLPAAEVNSTFRKTHRPSTVERWANSVPEHFRFSVKAPRQITHEKGLSATAADFRMFLEQVAPFGEKLGPLLFQLPPKLAFDAIRARQFFDELRSVFTGQLAVEPRHASWFVADVAACLAGYEIARVGADPAPTPGAGDPGGWEGLTYLRLHGSPRMYYSGYGPTCVGSLAERLIGLPRGAWCIFDNTAAGEAAADALSLQALMHAVIAGGPDSVHRFGSLVGQGSCATHDPPRHT